MIRSTTASKKWKKCVYSGTQMFRFENLNQWFGLSLVSTTNPYIQEPKLYFLGAGCTAKEFVLTFGCLWLTKLHLGASGFILGCLWPYAWVLDDVPARLWLGSPGFGLEALGFGLEKTKPGPSGTAPAWPGLALAQARAFRYYL
ncbi:hypothetical protein F5050DRAFT_1714858 [Lentinula boryana]|uniref:Uncharacterized protein n=1 Tax=Lentinula boryana TaxID=40481 RepID=A0ABQ8Q2L3_9AGAR|nr:hypothetical protein F5050DRAFT_1714858 [Lentinula boryana]